LNGNFDLNKVDGRDGKIANGTKWFNKDHCTLVDNDGATSSTSGGVDDGKSKLHERRNMLQEIVEEEDDQEEDAQFY